MLSPRLSFGKLSSKSSRSSLPAQTANLKYPPVSDFYIFPSSKTIIILCCIQSWIFCIKISKAKTAPSHHQDNDQTALINQPSS